MSDFMNGFFRALAMPNSAENMYQAGKALSDWIGDHRQQMAAHERVEQNMDFNAPVLRKVAAPADSAGNAALRKGPATFDDLYSRGSGASMTGQKAQDGYEFVNRHQNEADKLFRELHQGLVNFMNSDNPDPNAAVGNNPVAPRGRHVENPVIDNRRR